MKLIRNMRSDITILKLPPNLPGANELRTLTPVPMHCGDRVRIAHRRSCLAFRGRRPQYLISEPKNKNISFISSDFISLNIFRTSLDAI